MSEPAPQSMTVEDALQLIVGKVAIIVDVVRLDLLEAHGAVLSAPVFANHTQPPFDASAMDGYAVRAADLTGAAPLTLHRIGEAAAGHGYAGRIGPGDAVRIFTGAPMPEGADTIVIQEDVRATGNILTIDRTATDREHIRPKGGDFTAGQQVLPAGQRIAARHIALAAAAGHAQLNVRRPPRVAILATGDELVMPGVSPAAGQIVCSNPFGIAAMVTAAGGTPMLLGIAADTTASLESKLQQAEGADILVTLGGASVGDHDLIVPVLTRRGIDLAFWKIAMRPGKPMLFGRLGATHVLGLPGNPVSSLITARLFLVPLIHALLGLPPQDDAHAHATLGEPLPANGPRAHYMRGVHRQNATDARAVYPLPNQDSSLLLPLAAADCLIVRPIRAPALPAGATVPILPIDF